MSELPSSVYLTTPLYYVNAQPHLGHSYTTFVVDTVRRFYRQRGIPVWALTGTDEHGEKIQAMADKLQSPPQEWADEVSAAYKALWQDLGLEFDRFYRTTETPHKIAVQFALQKLKDAGEIVFREYEGNYCVGCERFITDTELNAEGLCPDHLKAPEKRKEANYFFLMSKYQDRLRQHFSSHPNSIQPEMYRGEILSFLEQPLQDLCISRPKARLTWGIELPFDAGFVTYVWFDALLNYLVATGWPEAGFGWNTNHFGPATHFIGKDILKTHAIYWGAILMALDVPLFKTLAVNGYLLFSGNKMSKSLGNTVPPAELVQQFGVEAVRYFFLREMTFGMDSSFSIEALVATSNAHLANGIGNLASRVMTLAHKNLQPSWTIGELLPQDLELQEKIRQTVSQFESEFREFHFSVALKAWNELVTAVDVYVNLEKPWALAKDPAQSARLATVLGICLQALHTLATLIVPVLPNSAPRLLEALGIESEDEKKPQAHFRSTFQFKGEVPKLFPRWTLEEAAADV